MADDSGASSPRARPGRRAARILRPRHGAHSLEYAQESRWFAAALAIATAHETADSAGDGDAGATPADGADVQPPPDDASPTEASTLTVACPEGDLRLTIRRIGATGFDIVGGNGTNYGSGATHLPICPVHSVETAVVSPLPAEEAFRLAAEFSAPVQPALFEKAKPFNTDGALAELFAQAHTVKRLRDEWDVKAEIAKDAKKAYDKAAALQTDMALEFERRKREKDAQILAAQDQEADDERPETTAPGSDESSEAGAAASTPAEAVSDTADRDHDSEVTDGTEPIPEPEATEATAVEATA